MSTPTNGESLQKLRQDAAEELHKLANGKALTIERGAYLRRLAEFVEHNETVLEVMEALRRLDCRSPNGGPHAATIFTDNSGLVGNQHRHFQEPWVKSAGKNWTNFIDSLRPTPTGPPEEITPGMEVPLENNKHAIIYNGGEFISGVWKAFHETEWNIGLWHFDGSSVVSVANSPDIDWPTYWQEQQ